METMNVFEAVRIATDPFGAEGVATGSHRPSAKEVLERLGKMGFAVVPREMTRISFTVEEPLEGIEQYQVESR
jgi:hypothetical protein